MIKFHQRIRSLSSPSFLFCFYQVSALKYSAIYKTVQSVCVCRYDCSWRGTSISIDVLRIIVKEPYYESYCVTGEEDSQPTANTLDHVRKLIKQFWTPGQAAAASSSSSKNNNTRQQTSAHTTNSSSSNSTVSSTITTSGKKGNTAAATGP